MFYLYQNITLPINNNYLFYYYPQQIQPQESFSAIIIKSNSDLKNQLVPDQKGCNKDSQLGTFQKPELVLTQSQHLQGLFSMSQKNIQVRINSQVIKKNQTNCIERPKITQVKLDFRIQWNNENRNIVPKLTNQMISYAVRKGSQRLVHKLFQTLPHDEKWTQKKFYLYMKRLKDSVTNYVNQNAILKFLEIHEPKCELYDYEEQLFYMRICRILVKKFLQNDAILISLTSNRMSSAKRMIHLIARQALKRKFLELCKQHMF